MARGRKQKPSVHTSLVCPHCKAEMELKVFRDVVSPAIPAEITYRNEIQLLMVPGSGAGKDKNKTEKKKAPAKK